MEIYLIIGSKGRRLCYNKTMDEAIIERVRGAIRLGMSLDEIVAHFTDAGVAIEVLFLAYHAALILEAD